MALSVTATDNLADGREPRIRGEVNLDLHDLLLPFLPSIVQWQVMKYLPTDSVCFHDETDRDLFKQQKKLWRPMWRWVEKNYGYSLDVVDGIKATKHPAELADAIKADVEAMDTWQLTALQVGWACCVLLYFINVGPFDRLSCLLHL